MSRRRHSDRRTTPGATARSLPRVGCVYSLEALTPTEPTPASNPYAPPQATSTPAPAAAYRTVQIGLAWYAALELLSAPFAVLAAQKWELVLRGFGVEPQFNTYAGAFYGVRAASDLGVVIAFVAGLVWLHGAWKRTRTRGRKTSVSPGAVVGWCLVPIWGFWRLHGFLLELAKRCGLDEEKVKVSRWWWVTAAHLVVRVVLTQNRIPGWLHVGDSVLAAVASVLGIAMVTSFQRAMAREAGT